jgi:uncharacterized protein (TIGR03000 family)
MICAWRSLTWAAALATMALLFASLPARAQSSPAGYYYETFRYGYNPGYYARRYTAPPAGNQSVSFGAYGGNAKTAPTSVTPGTWLRYAAAAPTAQPQIGGFSRAPVLSVTRAAEQIESADTTVQIELRVPADAEVWLDGVRTWQAGESRLFVSPPLTSGKKYSYEVRVTWKEGDQEKVEKRDLGVRAGDRLSESFPAVGR